MQAKVRTVVVMTLEMDEEEGGQFHNLLSRASCGDYPEVDSQKFAQEILEVQENALRTHESR